MVIQRFRPFFSGQGVQLEELCRELAQRGARSTIYTATRGREVTRESCDGYEIRRLRCDLPGIGWTRHNNRFWMPFFALRTLAALSRRRKAVDIVHVHSLTDALHAARLFGWLWQVPVIFEMTLLGTDDPLAVRASPNRFQRQRYASYRGCDAFVAISPALARRYREAGLPENRIRVIPQGVDTERFQPLDPAAKAAARRVLGLPENALLILFAGSLIYRKGIDVLLLAWERLHRRYPEAHLLLLGKDRFPEAPAADAFLATQIGRLSAAAAEQVIRLGRRDDPQALMRCADLFLFPSRREGFGSVIIEAMACGLPCVVSDLPGITDYIFAALCTAEGLATTDQSDGVVVDQEDDAALALAATALIDTPVAAAIGQRARQRACEAFGLQQVAPSYLDLYTSLRSTAERR